MAHDKISFAREYCKCRRIPCRVKGEALFVGGRQACYSLLNLSYQKIIEVVDGAVSYNACGFYDGPAA